MVGITKYDLCFDIFPEFALVNRLYRGCCANRHKNRGFDGAVIGFYKAGPGFGMRVFMEQREFQMFGFSFGQRYIFKSENDEGRESANGKKSKILWMVSQTTAISYPF